ncbi:MAG: SAM-dependent methyltransferase [Acidimicrobiaceae bacterium]|nr:SAM-dependent methyltransferase [Acidimicrobiaceae bacterium]MDE0514710.1 SAM-dependent methyltransferase [Acidimicrobiaceae bacterium]MDE0656721.1 SAM-dependent methyltransferase [Acidimicrobiaceae bacterium]
MPVSEYVEACLYDSPEGFYMRSGGGRAGGRSGHFLTAPEVGPLFGAVLARALDAWWAALGEPDPFTVIDWGAGPGTLARSVLAAEPGCMAAGALRLVLVELSPAQRALHPELPLVASVGHVSDVLPQSASAGVIVANELLDNLPFDVVRRTADGWEELRVTVEDGASDRFSLVATPASPELVAGLPEVAAGARIPVQRAARGWAAEAYQLLGEGWIVALDYGAETPVLAERAGRSDDPAAGLGWLRTHRDHDDGSWWLAEPGSCDITADVALDQVQADYPAEVCTQAEFLRGLGIDELVAEGRAVWTERAGVGDLDALRARSRTSEAEALLDPAGMGAFSVLVWSVD